MNNKSKSALPESTILLDSLDTQRNGGGTREAQVRWPETLQGVKGPRFKGFYKAIRVAAFDATLYAGDFYVFQKPRAKQWTMLHLPPGRHFEHAGVFHIAGGCDTEDWHDKRRRLSVESAAAKQKYHSLFYEKIAESGNAKFLRNNYDWFKTSGYLLVIAAAKDDAKVIKAVCAIGGNVNYRIVTALYIAARRGNKNAVSALLKAKCGSFIRSRKKANLSLCPRLPVTTIVKIIHLIKKMRLSESLEIFDNLVEVAPEEPKIRDACINLLPNYPKTFAKIL